MLRALSLLSQGLALALREEESRRAIGARAWMVTTTMMISTIIIMMTMMMTTMVTIIIMISTTMAVVVSQRLEELEIALRAERERAEQREATQRRDARAAAEVSH
eukprot:SAG25_NODE_266_length_10666_cov_14.508943_4_plen_105_part_00